MPTGVGTGPVQVNTPGGVRRVQIGVADAGFYFMADDSAVINAPRWAVPDLLSAGCTRVDGQTETINVRAELVAATEIGDLFGYLASQDEPMSIVDPATGLPRQIENVRTAALAVYDAA
jgi:hypothetical protein